MGDRLNQIQTEPEQVQKTREDLDRRVFHLRTLFEASRELAGIIQPKRLLEEFLLTALGALGIAQGLAALVNTKTGQGQVVGRGVDRARLEAVAKELPEISALYLVQGELTVHRVVRPRMVPNEKRVSEWLAPAQSTQLTLWHVSKDYSGFMALGDKVSGLPCDEADLDLILNLTNVLTSAMGHALSVLSIQQLNASLLKKNAELEEALAVVQLSRDELDKRIFHLKSLSDLNQELSGLVEVDQLLPAYLLSVMGSIGAGQGCVLISDRRNRTSRLIVRGLPNDPEIGDEAREKLLYRSFESSESKSLSPMSVGRLLDFSPFAAAGLNIDASAGLFFVIDPSLMGMVTLGRPLKGTSLSTEDVELLATQTSSFMVFLKNAKLFEAIQELNADLTRRNEELRRTIAELTEAKEKITLLEKARTRLRALIEQEAGRVDRATPFDVALVLTLALAVGVFFNVVAPQGIPLVQESVFRPSAATVDAIGARKLIEEGGALLVDARPKELFEQKHIKGAASIPISLFEIMYMMKLSSLDPEKPLIVYGRTISRRYDEELAFRLKQRDHEAVRVLDGGLAAWEAQGYPTE